MKALILSVSAGGGHTQASEALKKNILLRDPESEVIIVDTIKYINPLLDKVVIGGYLKSLKISPSLFGKVYYHSDADEGIANVTNAISSWFNEAMTFKLLPLINEVNPDILICTHFFPIEMVSILKSKGKITIPCLSIITDYYSHYMWLHQNIDSYIVSNDEMIEDLVSKGVERSSVHALGIPVCPDFLAVSDKEETLKELDLKADIPTILVMGGSLGLGKIKAIYEELLKVDTEIQIIVITGSNSKLYSELENLKETSQKETRIIGFTNEVNKLMRCSDLLVTKPGGMTITESLICGIPLVLFSPLPGHEEKNGDFLIRHNLAVNISEISDCAGIIENLLSDKTALGAMKANCKYYSKPNAGEDIYNLITDLIGRKGTNGATSYEDGLSETESGLEKLRNIIKSIEMGFVKTLDTFHKPS